MVILLCGLFELTRVARAPKSSARFARFPTQLEGLTAIWYVSFGKLWEETKETFAPDWCSLRPCCSVLCKVIRTSQRWFFFFYLNIISSGPANCLKWKVLAGKPKLQQIGLFERQWHFKIDILKLPHAFWKQKEIKGWYFSETSQKHRHSIVTDQSEFCVFLVC